MGPRWTTKNATPRMGHVHADACHFHPWTPVVLLHLLRDEGELGKSSQPTSNSICSLHVRMTGYAGGLPNGYDFRPQWHMAYPLSLGCLDRVGQN